MPQLPQFETPDVKVETPEGGATMEFRAGQHIGGTFSRIGSDIARTGDELLTAHLKQVTDRETLSGLAQEAQDDQQAYLGLQQTATQDIMNDTHDPTFGVRATQTYAQALSQGVQRYSTLEGRQEYIRRAQDRIRSFANRADSMVATAQAAQVPIDFARFEGGIYRQADSGGLAQWDAINQSIDAQQSTLKSMVSTPEAAAEFEKHSIALRQGAFLHAAQADIQASAQPDVTMQAILSDPRYEDVAPQQDRELRAFTDKVNYDRRIAANQQAQADTRAAVARESQLYAQVDAAQSGAKDENGNPIQMPTRVQLSSDPVLSKDPTAVTRVESYMDNAGKLTDDQKTDFYNTTFQKIIAAARAGRPMADAAIMSYAGQYGELASRLVEVNKMITHRSETKVSPAGTKIWADTDTYIRKVLGPIHNSPALVRAAEPKIQAALAYYDDRIYQGLAAGVDPADLMDTTGRSENSVFKSAPLTNFGNIGGIGRTPATATPHGPRTQAEANAFFGVK